ncbi:MAG TPA: HD domain-containing protein [Candidatus Saccharimonadales bacterium]|nr:HD domain-containing protein [Candidatus Saccharimonadales bacterium]
MGSCRSIFERLSGIQQLVTDVSKVNRNHRVLGTERRENVIEHSFAAAMMCWQLCLDLELDLDLGKVFKYVMVHDFTERGLEQDFNAYLHAGDRAAKDTYEAAQLDALVVEFADFSDFTTTLTNYRDRADSEAWFTESVEKMQAIVLDQMDGWRAHIAIGASYDDYCAHHKRVLDDCFPPLHDILADVIEYGRQTYYDQPI